MTDFLTLCQQTRMDCGMAGTGPSTTLAQSGEYEKLVKWVADADLHIATRWEDWRFLWSAYQLPLTAGQAVYPLADLPDIAPGRDMATHLGHWDEDSFRALDSYVRIPYREWTDFSDHYVPQSTSALPTHYTIRPDRALVFSPTPSQAWTLTAELWMTPSRLLNPLDEPLVPAPFRRAIVCRAKMHYAEYEEVSSLYDTAMRELEEWMNRLESAYLPTGNWRNRSESADDQYVVIPQ